MDIDVKNSLNSIISAYEALSDMQVVKNAFALEIYNFIHIISLNNAENRFDAFNKIYLKGEYNFNNLDLSSKTDFFKDFCKYNDTQKLISFFSALGKYYLYSKFDKKDIDRVKFIEYIAAINKPISTEFETVNSSKNVICSTEPKQQEMQEKPTEDTLEPEETLEELLTTLHSLIGLKSVKNEVEQIINLISVQKKGEEFGEKAVPLSLHLVFYGNPGTGKTTVARLLAKIYKHLGVLSTGQLIEVDRSGLVGGYVGQTALKTQEVIDKAMGGILFIDEAYSLTHGKGESDFGQEAVDTILKAMEDHRDDFIVIVAGYPDLMKEFISSNPGLKSRFNQYIYFEDYKPDELFDIFKFECKKQNLILSDDCEEYLLKHFENVYNNRTDDYANGRDVRNFFEKAFKMRANRLKPILDKITYEEFKTMTLEDLINASKLKQTIN